MTIYDLTEPGGTQIDRGSGVFTVEYLDGTIRIRHRCRIVDDGELWTAPTLTPGPSGHQVISRDPLTIQPSIFCPDCKLHGWVTDGRWVE